MTSVVTDTLRGAAWISIVSLIALLYLEAIGEHGWYTYVLLSFCLAERVALLIFTLMVRRMVVKQAQAMYEAIQQGSGHMRDLE